MKTTSRVLVIGDIESVERKTINDKALAEFRVADLGLRISAWEDRAKQVPERGVVIVEGYLATRSYTHEGVQRQTTEIRATSIQAIEGTTASDEPF